MSTYDLPFHSPFQAIGLSQLFDASDRIVGAILACQPPLLLGRRGRDDATRAHRPAELDRQRPDPARSGLAGAMVAGTQSDRDVLCLAGGTGLAPVKARVREIAAFLGIDGHLILANVGISPLDLDRSEARRGEAQSGEAARAIGGI